MKFKEGRNEKWLNEAEALEKFKSKIKGWMTLPEGTDYCPHCWEKMDKMNKLTEGMKKDARPTIEFVEKRKGTEGWSVICQTHDPARKDGEEFVPFLNS